MTTHLVFVYGTLRRGEPNHALLRDAAHICDAFVPGLLLRDLGPYPAAHRTTKLAEVAGEIYEVSERQLEGLDHLEGHPRYYQRELMYAERAGTRLPIDKGVWVYLMAERSIDDRPLVRTGDWCHKERPRRWAN